MKSLPKTLFSGGENISENDKKRLFVNNFSDNLETVLGDFSWDGKATGIIGLTLSNDNRRVEIGRFYTREVLQERSIKVAASEIWENAHESASPSPSRCPEPRCSSSRIASKKHGGRQAPRPHPGTRKGRVANWQVLSQAGMLRQQILRVVDRRRRGRQADSACPLDAPGHLGFYFRFPSATLAS
jgi:hypothetical protein